MADNASCLVSLSDTTFIYHIPSAYPQPQNQWPICRPSPNIFSCITSIMQRMLCKQELNKISNNRVCAGSAETSENPCCSILILKIRTFLKSISYRCTDTESVMSTTLSSAFDDLGKNQFIRHWGDCENPSTWWSPQYYKPPGFSVQHQNVQTPHLVAYNLWHKRPTHKSRKGFPYWYNTICHNISYPLHWLKDPQHNQPGQTGIVLFPQSLQLHQVYQAYPGIPVKSNPQPYLLSWE